MHLRDPAILSNVEIEEIEKQSLRYLYTAAYDFGLDAFDIFHQSSDEPKDIAEEIRLAYVGVTRARKKLFLVMTVNFLKR